MKTITLDTEKDITQIGVKAFLQRKEKLPGWINDPVPENEQTKEDVSQEYESLKKSIGLSGFSKLDQLLQEKNPEKIKSFIKINFKDRPDIQMAVIRLLKFL